MRFDDTLDTVMAADLGSPQAAQSAWRQLVDLIGRRRAAADADAMATLRAIRDEVPLTARAASARALEFADPPAALVRLFATDELSVALPVLRSARLDSAEWIQLLPDLAPAARGLLRNRRDLGPAVKRALEAFGPIDFVLSDATARTAPPHLAEPAVNATPVSEPIVPGAGEAEDFSFVALAGDAAVLPDLASEPDGQSEIAAGAVQSGTVGPLEAIASAPPSSQTPPMDHAHVIEAETPAATLALLLGDAAEPGDDAGTFEIADVVKRIDAFWRHREETGPVDLRRIEPAEHFRFETDSKGVFRWVDGVNRAALIGLSLDLPAAAAVSDASRIDAIAAGAFRRRAGFANARLTVEGESDAAGDWLISAIPAFDPANGRFTGYRGTARRPRPDERADPVREPGPIAADSLRQLVHELRTPTNAIAGFAEMIQSEMLGPVSDHYRERAGTIREQARELLGAIDDLDLAARIDSSALALIPGRVALRPVLAAIADDLAPLAQLRGSIIALPIHDLAVSGDRRAVERLLARLLATLVSASGASERIGVRLSQIDGMVAIAIDRPRALADYPGESVLGIDDEREDMTLLGTGFALRLARNLARELGGALVIEPESLTLRLPGSDNAIVGQAHLS